jgi:hypothetical protein
MEESETVTIDGAEFEIDAIEAVLDRIEDDSGNVQGGVGVVDGVVVAGDSDNDSFVRVAHADDVDILPYGNGVYELSGEYKYKSGLRDVIEDVRQSNFTSYIADIDGITSSNAIGLADDANVDLGSGTDAYIAYRFLSAEEMQTLVADEGVEISKTKADGNETVYVGLRDVRDE